MTIVFGGDFKQILPVIVKGSQPEIVGACMQRSHAVWSCIQVLKLKRSCENTNKSARGNEEGGPDEDGWPSRQGCSRLHGEKCQPQPQYQSEMQESHLLKSALSLLGTVENAKR